VKISVLGLRQRDGTTCGPAAAVVAGAMLDAGYRPGLSGSDADAAWFSREQARVHQAVNRMWPRRLGTTPAGMVHAISPHCPGRATYRWRPWRGRRDRMTDVLDSVAAGWPVALLVGHLIPRHWVLLVGMSGDTLQCYEPSSGQVLQCPVAALARAQIQGVGYPRPFAFVLPRR
jgi:hypothetical protein